MMAYTGAVAAMMLPAISNGYMIYKAVVGAVGTGGAFKYFYQYANGNWGYLILGEFKALIETSFFLAIALWGVWQTFVGFWTGFVMWEHIFNDEASFDGQEERGYKWLFMGASMGLCSWAGSVAVAELLEKILGFYDTYNNLALDWDSKLTNIPYWVDGFFWFVQWFATMWVAGQVIEGSYYVGYSILKLKFIDEWEPINKPLI